MVAAGSRPENLLVTLLLLMLARDGHGLRLTRVDVPSPVQAGTRTMLSCFFELDWTERVYTVNWYRDGQEFFRYEPSAESPIQTFNQAGIFVDALASNMTTVVLRTVSLHSAGRYRCEIATEAPRYITVHAQRDMVVVDLPSSGPTIAGVLDEYRVGEPVHINCTSARSRPAASLTWYINDEQADPSLVLKYPVQRHNDGLETSKIGLRFRLRHAHFRREHGIRIKCAAEISTLYWRTHEAKMWGRTADSASRQGFSGGSRIRTSAYCLLGVLLAASLQRAWYHPSQA